MFAGSTAGGAWARIAFARAWTRPLKGLELVVDLAAEPIGKRWARGAATLAILCGTALALAPGFDPFSAALAQSVAPSGQFQMNAMLSGGPAPEQPQTAEFDTPFPSAKPVIAANGSEVRVQGAVTDGLYWSLRSAGVPSQSAAEYLHALSTRIDVGSDVAPYDRFDIVIGKGGSAGQVLYAAVHRAVGGDIALMKWNSGGRTDWFDAGGSGGQRSAGLMAPVAGRITSGFGMRYHPILHFARFHAGIDFGAAWGSPIVAAADGQVVAAGWSGGYGRQVQVAHGGGIVSSYGHMSSIVASPGETVRQGQVIGYVGSTGLSTGPHVHFEVRLNGRPVDPMQVTFRSQTAVSAADRQAFDARLKQLLSIGQGKA